MHRILAAEILNPIEETAARESRASGLLEAFDLLENLAPKEVLNTVDRYRAIVGERFQPRSESIEVPFTYCNEVGQRLSGFVDHLLETGRGPVILDHKIFPGKREDWAEKALSYSGQLAAYADVLATGAPARIYIHLVTAGALIEVLLPMVN